VVVAKNNEAFPPKHSKNNERWLQNGQDKISRGIIRCNMKYKFEIITIRTAYLPPAAVWYLVLIGDDEDRKIDVICSSLMLTSEGNNHRMKQYEAAVIILFTLLLLIQSVTVVNPFSTLALIILFKDFFVGIMGKKNRRE
jgi:hypothetical protein